MDASAGLIRLSITEDHPLVVDGFINALRPHGHIRILDTYSRGAALFAGLGKGQVPDVLLLDAQLPDMSGMDIARMLSRDYPAVAILVISSIESHFFIQNMMKAGCRGYLLKSTADSSILLEAIEAVSGGRQYLDPGVREELLLEMLRADRKSVAVAPKITEREMEVLRLISAAYDNQEIADKLFISLRTVENYKHRLLQKLEAKNMIDMVRKAVSLGLVE